MIGIALQIIISKPRHKKGENNLRQELNKAIEQKKTRDIQKLSLNSFERTVTKNKKID